MFAKKMAWRLDKEYLTIQTLGHIFETLATINEIAKCYNYGAKAFSVIALLSCFKQLKYMKIFGLFGSK